MRSAALVLEERLRRMARGLVRDGVVTPVGPEGLPWALTIPQAARRIRISPARVGWLVAVGRLRRVDISAEPLISASSVRQELVRHLHPWIGRRR